MPAPASKISCPCPRPSPATGAILCPRPLSAGMPCPRARPCARQIWRGRRWRGQLQGGEDDGSKFSIEKVEFPMSKLPRNNCSSYLKKSKSEKKIQGGQQSYASILVFSQSRMRVEGPAVLRFFPPPLANHGRVFKDARMLHA